MKRLGKLASYFFSGKLLNYTKACENKFPRQDKIDFLNPPKMKTLKLKHNKCF